MLSHKIMKPGRNHETRQIQKRFSFQTECLANLRVNQVGQLLDHVMDYIFCVYFIDEAIFSFHGEIPTSVSCIKDLNLIPTSLEDNRRISNIEIVWNDPVDETKVK